LSNGKIHNEEIKVARTRHYIEKIANMNTFGSRFSEERRRLKLSQEGLAEAVGISKRAVGSYEREERSPDADILMRLIGLGMDVHYVLTGKRVLTRLDLEPMQRAVLDDFERCSLEKQIEAVRYMAVLAGGVPTLSAPAGPSVIPAPKRTKSAD
jgi:transcriptional regulator with XRE-family HTH domain